MPLSGDEYPFWARWMVSGVPAADITSVDYNVRVYNPSTDVFDNVSTGSIVSADANGKWIAPFTIPTSTGFKKYVTLFTPIGGSHPILNDEINTLDGLITEIEDGGIRIDGCGTESHSSRVIDPDGTPIVGASVRASPYGTSFVEASAFTNGSGIYVLNGLVKNHAYIISYNADGYWARQTDTVIA